jgi:hypothetical protein
MGELIKLLGRLFYGLASVIDGSFLSELGVAAKLREWAKAIYDGVGSASGKIGDVTGMSRTDALTLLNSALTAVSSTFPTNNNQSDLQKNITVILILTGYVLDTAGHNEKMSSLKNLQSENLILTLGKLIKIIQSVKTSKTPWGALDDVPLAVAATDGFEKDWNDCCIMEITLRDGRAFKIHNLSNMYNAYKFIGALSGFAAFGVSMTNFVLALNVDHSLRETSSPSVSPSFIGEATLSTPQPYNDSVGLGIAGAIPIRFVSDAKMVLREETTIAQFLEETLSSLEKELDLAKKNKRETALKEIPAGLTVLLEKEGMSDGLKKLAVLSNAYRDHNDSFVSAKIKTASDDAIAKIKAANDDAAAKIKTASDEAAVKVQAANDSATQAEQQRLVAISEKTKAESERDEANKAASALKADNLMKQENIEFISKALFNMESELNKEKEHKEANSIIMESLANMILDDCFKECKLTVKQKRMFIDKLKICLPEPRSSTITEILNKLEENCIEHKDEILSAIFASPNLSRVSSAPIANKAALEMYPPKAGLPPPLMPMSGPLKRSVSSNVSSKSNLSKEWGASDSPSIKSQSPKLKD